MIIHFCISNPFARCMRLSICSSCGNGDNDKRWLCSERHTVYQDKRVHKCIFLWIVFIFFLSSYCPSNVSFHLCQLIYTHKYTPHQIDMIMLCTHTGLLIRVPILSVCVGRKIQTLWCCERVRFLFNRFVFPFLSHFCARAEFVHLLH